MNSKSFINISYDELRPLPHNSKGYFISKIEKKYTLHSPSGKELTDHKFDNFAINNNSAEGKVTLAKNRSIVAVAMNRNTEGIYEYIAIDDEGNEYSFERN